MVAVGAVAVTLWFLELGPAKQATLPNPAQISLLYGSKQYSGAQGSYCWNDAIGHGECVDFASASSRKDIPPPIAVSSGSTVCFEMVGFPQPQSFHVSVALVNSSSSAVVGEDVSSCMVVTKTAGDYYLTVMGAWSGRDTSNVFELHVT